MRPPIFVTSPAKLISPVIAISLLTFFFRITEIKWNTEKPASVAQIAVSGKGEIVTFNQVIILIAIFLKSKSCIKSIWFYPGFFVADKAGHFCADQSASSLVDAISDSSYAHPVDTSGKVHLHQLCLNMPYNVPVYRLYCN